MLVLRDSCKRGTLLDLPLDRLPMDGARCSPFSMGYPFSADWLTGLLIRLSHLLYVLSIMSRMSLVPVCSFTCPFSPVSCRLSDDLERPVVARLSRLLYLLSPNRRGLTSLSAYFETISSARFQSLGRSRPEKFDK